MTNMKQQYEWMEAREHVLKRPIPMSDPSMSLRLKGTHSKRTRKTSSSAKPSNVPSPALFKIFDEIVTNAIDNSKRSASQRFIKATVDKETGMFTCSNDGDTIPVRLWENSNRYVPEVLFVELLSGSNFKDEREQVGGRNGLGSKICNLLSTWFQLEIVNLEDGKKYKQVFKRNTYEIGKPKVLDLANKDKRSSITISWIPDYQRLGITLPLADEIVDLFRTRLYDAAAVTNSSVSVYFNEAKLSIKTLKDYSALLGGQLIGRDEVLVGSNVALEFCISAVSRENGDRSRTVGFVNGLQCSQGSHVELIYRRVTEALNEIVKKRMKKAAQNVRPQLVKDSLVLLVNLNVDNPSFTSQTKEKLDTSVDKFGFKYPEISAALVKQLEKSSVVDEAIKSIQAKEDKDVNKSLQSTRKQRLSIAKYQRATKRQANLTYRGRLRVGNVPIWIFSGWACRKRRDTT